MYPLCPRACRVDPNEHVDLALSQPTVLKSLQSRLAEVRPTGSRHGGRMALRKSGWRQSLPGDMRVVRTATMSSETLCVPLLPVLRHCRIDGRALSTRDCRLSRWGCCALAILYTSAHQYASCVWTLSPNCLRHNASSTATTTAQTGAYLHQR